MIRLPAFHFALVLAASFGLGACASSTGPGPADPDGSAFAQARAAYLAEDYPRALALMRSEAALGNPRAQYTLGYMYYHGQGVPQDMEQALQWIRQAAAQGDPRALEALSALAAAGMRPQEPANAPAEQ